MFVTAHAIKLHPKNFYEITSTVFANYDALQELYRESLSWGMPWYIVGERSESGQMTWKPLNAAEVCVEYELKSFLDYRYDDHFCKL